MSQLADWKCHKIVKAGKILAFGEGFNGPVTVEVNGAPCKVEVTPNTFARGRPNLGMIYEDGYKSWSPAKAFRGRICATQHLGLCV